MRAKNPKKAAIQVEVSMSEKQLSDLANEALCLNDRDRASFIEMLVAGPVASRDPLHPVRVGLTLRHKGNLSISDEIFERCLSASSRPSALYELGVSKALQGQVSMSVTYLETRLRESGLLPREMIFFAMQYARQGRLAAAKKMLERATAISPTLRRECLTAMQAFEFINRFDEHRARGLLEDVVARFKVYAGPEEIEVRVMHAIEERSPFLMTRIGDGETSALRLDLEDESHYNLLYSANLAEFLLFWFGDSDINADGAFGEAIQDLSSALCNADVLGVFHLDGLEHEYRIGSRRGITWAVNGLRLLLKIADEQPDRAGTMMVGNPNVHYQLGATGALERIVGSQTKIGVISCHADLPDSLRARFGVEEVEYLKIPGEQSNREALGTEAVAGRHWPDRYREVRHAIQGVDRSGMLFLVAAGVLGRIYASDLKNTGAIVLDIGSVADALMGKQTRSFPAALKSLGATA